MFTATLGFTRRAGELGITRRRRFFIIEVLQCTTLDFIAKHALDALDQRLVLTGNKGKRIAGLCGAACAADAVRVCIRRIRDVIIDHMGY
jgi:hypothetical protein